MHTKPTCITEKVLEQKLDYIHWNPVEAGIISYPDQYKYSSAKFYRGKEDVPFLTRYEEHI